MKKITLFLALLITATAVYAQSDESKSEVLKDYNHWSIEAEAGISNAVRPIKSGYYTDNYNLWGGDIGVRYMINERFGFKLKGGVDHFQQGDNSARFHSNLWRASLEGVVNLGEILGFRDWTQTFNLLAHGGAGYGYLKPEHGYDQVGFITAGLTPQVRLSNKVALNADVSIYGNMKQDYTYDGNGKTNVRGFNGYHMNVSAGIMYYFGSSSKKHADWHKRIAEQDELSKLQDDVAQIQEDMQDTDRDGVPDYLDEEPNTPAGVMVDTKGRAIDKNENGIPDEMEDALDKRYAKAGEAGKGSGSSSDMIAKLINDGYVNVYFGFDSDKPEPSSVATLNYIIRYFEENSDAEAEIIGYTDKVGSEDYNKDLAERRAQTVKDILTSSGIDEGKLEITGYGKDDSREQSSDEVRGTTRRVTLKLK